jgi:hypothetical protein
MKKFRLLFCLFIGFFVQLHAQVVSKFTWETNPVTTAVVGPNGISASASAISSAGGKTGNGLNPGTPTADVNLTLTGSPTFDMAGIDISVDFLRRETIASFYKRGANFDFGMTGSSIYANFMLSNGAGGSITVNSGGVYSVPADNAYHNYRFIYYNIFGKAQIVVDGAVVYTYSGTANTSMYWTGAGNVVIGTLMDAAGTNLTTLDNFILQNPPNVVLPVKLQSFVVKPAANKIQVSWTTSNEFACDYFEVERSSNGLTFEQIAKVQANNQANLFTYKMLDDHPLTGKNFYRLKLIDLDGSFTYSQVLMVDGGAPLTFINGTWEGNVIAVNCGGMPVGRYSARIFSLSGQQLWKQNLFIQISRQSFSFIMPASTHDQMILLEIQNDLTSFRKTLKLIHRK